MKITIIGSSAFREKKVQLTDELRNLGHESVIHPHYIQTVKEGRTDILEKIDKGEHAQLKIDNDYIRWYYDAIVGSDAVLVVNLEKQGKKNYIGGNAFLEIGFAYVNDKKIFILNDIPQDSDFIDELVAMQPMVLKGDLSKIG